MVTVVIFNYSSDDSIKEGLVEMNESSFISTSSFVPTPGDMCYNSGSIVNHDDTDTDTDTDTDIDNDNDIDIDIASYSLAVMSHPVYYIQIILTDMFLVVMTIYYSSNTVYNGDFDSMYTTYLIGSIVNILQ